MHAEADEKIDVKHEVKAFKRKMATRAHDV